jgi:hypothetical protein
MVAANTSARASAQASASCASTFRTALIPQQIPRGAADFSWNDSTPAGFQQIAPHEQRIASLDAGIVGGRSRHVKKANPKPTQALEAPEPCGLAGQFPILSVLWQAP